MTYAEPTAEDVSGLESRAEVESKEALLARLREINLELRPLAKLHRTSGHGSPADSKRKRHRALISKQILADMKARGEKEPSEAALERMANADPEHKAFCEELEAGAERYEILMGEKEDVDYRLRARETELNCYSAELRLAR